MARNLILGIDVGDETLDRWTGWFAPDPQPFLVEGDEPVSMPHELRDTFELYGLAGRGLSVRWMSQAEFFELPQRERSDLVRDQVRLGRGLVPTVVGTSEDMRDAVRAQADGHRFVWWPSLLSSSSRRDILGRFVTGSRPPSRHSEVPVTAWRASEHLLPLARRLAGTFPPGSGPNCFGTVMTAAGQPGAESEWMQLDAFEEWLAKAARLTSSRDLDAVGVVMVWRDASQQAAHAAVTLGSGWALHKPSQGWMSPSMVLRADALIRSVRLNGLRLHRYALLRT